MPHLRINGKVRTIDVPPDMPLLWVLRDVIGPSGPLHVAHHREDLARPEGELPPFGRPDRRFIAFTGYHTDVYGEEIRALAIGDTLGQRGLPSLS